MTRDDAFEHILAALKETIGDDTRDISEATDLAEEGILDSLDTMSFLFELEKRLDAKLSSIDEDYMDFKVSSLIDIVMSDIG